jgi:hypothetical protein
VRSVLHRRSWQGGLSSLWKNSSVRGVEKHVEEEPDGRRCLEWVVRHSGCTYSGGCPACRINGRILLVILFPCDTGPVPASGAPDSWACHDGIGTKNFWHLRVDQQYPGVYWSGSMRLLWRLLSDLLIYFLTLPIYEFALWSCGLLVHPL